MKRLTTLAALGTLTAGPALAHGGAHVHPHGGEVWLALAFGAALLGGLVYVWGRK